MPQYPDTERFALSFQRAELTLNRKVYVGISNVSFDQPTESAALMGTRPYPLGETEGEMGLGEGTIAFSSEEERISFINDLGNGWRTKRWGLLWILTDEAQTKKVKHACHGCRVLANPFDHEGGPDPLGGDIIFSALFHTIDGKTPHTGMPAPTRT